MINATKVSRDKFYKEDHRDHEFILKGITDKEGKPFLPQNFSNLAPEDKQKVIGEGYQRFWNYFLTLIHQTRAELKKWTQEKIDGYNLNFFSRGIKFK